VIQLQDKLDYFFQIQYPEIGLDVIPRHRFMSAYEQRIEPPNKAHQYLLFAAEPYETIAFKVQSKEVDKGEGKFFYSLGSRFQAIFFTILFQK